MPKNPAVIFDLDGTLADTAPDLVSALNFALKKREFPEVTRDEVKQIVGQGAMAMIERACQIHKRRLSKGDLEYMHSHFLDHYQLHISRDSRLFPHVMEVVNELRSENIKVCICTNKYEGLARKFLRGMGIMERFDAVTGGDSFAFKKPDGRHLFETMKLADANMERAVMIGDSINDALAAKNAGIKLALVDFGYTDKPVQEMGADLLLSSFKDAAPKIRALLS
jgi:phosphoglycolate phosphatase